MSEQTTGRPTSPCGTTAGYQRHQREGDVPCADCRRASAEYMRKYRQRDGVRDREREYKYARKRALARLAAAHPAILRALIDEELAR